MLTKTVGKSRDDRKSCGGGGTLPKARRKKATGVANEQKECFSENDMCYGGDGDDDYDYDYDDDDDDDRGDDDEDDDEDVDDGNGDDDGADGGCVEEQTNGSAAAEAADHCGNSRRVQRNRRRGKRMASRGGSGGGGRHRSDKAVAKTNTATDQQESQLADGVAAKATSGDVGGSDKPVGTNSAASPEKLDRDGDE